jgi:hypothetical protein
MWDKDGDGGWQRQRQKDKYRNREVHFLHQPSHAVALLRLFSSQGLVITQQL